MYANFPVWDKTQVVNLALLVAWMLPNWKPSTVESKGNGLCCTCSTVLAIKRNHEIYNSGSKPFFYYCWRLHLGMTSQRSLLRMYRQNTRGCQHHIFTSSSDVTRLWSSVFTWCFIPSAPIKIIIDWLDQAAKIVASEVSIVVKIAAKYRSSVRTCSTTTLVTSGWTLNHGNIMYIMETDIFWRYM